MIGYANCVLPSLNKNITYLLTHNSAVSNEIRFKTLYLRRVF